ncbi:MAG: imidazoleglycerol-phosphate dehydratase, partial [Chloroflexi bacterium]|nr:imidazoleglycerol-phosphate dehydratase [Chloroflexota bacterium]
MSQPRTAQVLRETAETKVRVQLHLDGSGQYQVDTGVRMLDHLLSQLASHSRFDLVVNARGDAIKDHHHLVEDVAIALGQALNQALGERTGIVRMADAAVPLDETLVQVAVDLSGRGYAVVQADFAAELIADLLPDLVRHFLEAFAIEGRLNLHARALEGKSDHHKAEAMFKALARCLDQATRV